MSTARLVIKWAKALAIGLVTGSLAGCIDSEKPLFSDTEAIVVDNLAGDYVGAGGERYHVTLEGKTYKVESPKNVADSSLISVQKFNDQFLLAQIQYTFFKGGITYALIYVNPNYVLVYVIPCGGAIKKEPTVTYAPDPDFCTVKSERDMRTLAQLGADRFFANAKAIVPLFKSSAQ